MPVSSRYICPAAPDTPTQPVGDRCPVDPGGRYRAHSSTVNACRAVRRSWHMDRTAWPGPHLIRAVRPSRGEGAGAGR